MADGWIKIHKKIIKWEWYTDSKMVHLFLHLLFKAQYEDSRWKGLTVKRGQLISGLSSLSKATGISTQSLRTCLKRLKDSGEIMQKSTNRFSVITICNYEEYQATKKTANKQPTGSQQAANNIKEVKEVKEVKKVTKKSPAFHPKRLKPDFVSVDQWDNVLIHRKAMKATNTKLAIERLITQLNKAVDANFTIDQCLGMMVDRSWRGFKMEWMENAREKQTASDNGQIQPRTVREALIVARDQMAGEVIKQRETKHDESIDPHETVDQEVSRHRANLPQLPLS